MGSTVNIIWMWEKCVIALKAIHVVGQEQVIRMDTKSLPVILRPPNKEKVLEKWIKRKNNSIGSFREEDNESFKLLIQEFGISQDEQNSTGDKIDAFWEFIRSGDDEWLMSIHRTCLFQMCFL